MGECAEKLPIQTREEFKVGLEQDPQGGHGGWTMVKDHSVVRWTCPQHHPARRAVISRKSVCVVSPGLSSLLHSQAGRTTPRLPEACCSWPLIKLRSFGLVSGAG